MKSTALGSAVSVLLAFSAISYAKIQDPKPVQTVRTAPEQTGSQPVSPESAVSEPAVADSVRSRVVVKTEPPVTNTAPLVTNEDFEVAAQTYTATAYSLRGRTASGKPVSRGLIAADPKVLPIGTRVRVEAGTFSGEYEVADTGGAVKGRRIDIWTPTAREAMQFGRRAVKLTVLSFGGRRAKPVVVRPRLVNAATTQPTQLSDKQEK
jgi:3D (Asp-Asp-Asp) domain-containing protein